MKKDKVSPDSFKVLTERSKFGEILAAPAAISAGIVKAVKTLFKIFAEKMKETFNKYITDKLENYLKEHHSRIYKIYKWLGRLIEIIEIMLSFSATKFIEIATIVYDTFKSKSWKGIVIHLFALFGALQGTPAYTLITSLLGFEEELISEIQKLPKEMKDYLISSDAYLHGHVS